MRQGLRAAPRHNVGHSVPSESVWVRIVERITFGPSGAPEKPQPTTLSTHAAQPRPPDLAFPPLQDLQSISSRDLICL